MERAVYCYAWLPGRPNCHPVHTMKHIGMVEDLEKNRATMLCWSMMGSGAVSLPFLERQISGEIPPQLRFHGFMNDREFNEECLKRNILPYAVVYQAQGWEFPVVLNDGGNEILEMNFIRSDKEPRWYGLREFTQNRYPGLFARKFEDYFPDGLVNSDGEKVTDLYDECTTRDLYGSPTHSRWVEIVGMSRTCHGMCRNNPVWREYLKKIIEIQIDAGARAIQLDESETPICSSGYGGCFCRDCMKQFREYLRRRKAEGTLPEEMKGLDPDTFDYGAYLRERRVDWPHDFRNIPFSAVYWDFILEAHNRHFQEMISHCREYGRKSKNTDIRVSGNFTNMHLLYYPSLKDVDCCITELRRTVFRRHNWFRLAAGFTEEKDLILAESPYDGFIPKFVELIQNGRADDYYRLFMMEPAVHGCGMAFPYGAWMGNRTSESFYAPAKTGREVQDFLKNHDGLISKKSCANVLILYSYASYKVRDWQCGQGENLHYTSAGDLLSYSVTYDKRAERMPFFEISQGLTDRCIPYDVKVLGDGGLVPDTFAKEDLEGYEMVVVPDCFSMTESQTKLLERYAKEHPVCVYGRYAENISGAAERLSALKNVIAVPGGPDAEGTLAEYLNAVSREYAPMRTLFWDNENIYVQPAAVEGGRVCHVLNYAFDAERYRTVPQTFILEIRAGKARRLETVGLQERPVPYELLPSLEKSTLRIRLTDVPCYCAVILKD